MRSIAILLLSTGAWAMPGEVRAKLPTLSLDDERGQAAVDELAKGGEGAALEALEILAKPLDPAPAPIARRRLARIARQAGGARSIEPSIARLSDPDADVRAELLAFLVRQDLGEERLAERIDAIAAAALGDREPRVRGQAVDELAALDKDDAQRKLDAILPRFDEPLRARAAWMIAEKARSRPLALAKLPSSDPVLEVPALTALGSPTGVEDALSGAVPLLAALRSPYPEIRRAGAVGIDSLVRKTFSNADADKFAASMRELEERGFDREQGAILRARAALVFSADPKAALLAARELAALVPPNGTADERATLATARHLEACALLAAGSLDEARGAIAEEARILDGLLAERVDRESKSLASVHAFRLHRRAQCELLEAIRLLSSAGASDPPAEAFECARRIHSFELAAQVAEAPSRGTKASLDGMLEGDLSPMRLFLDNPRLPAWPAEKQLGVRKAIGRLFATVARAEAPGFDPYEPAAPLAERTADPLKDNERRARLVRIVDARSDELRDRLNELLQRVRLKMASDPTAPSDDEDEAIQQVYRDSADYQDIRQRVTSGDLSALLETRAPSLLAMALSRALRDEGKDEEARALAEKVRADLDASGELKRFLLVEAEIEMTVGSTWMDSNDPSRAEVELVRAVERLEAIEKALVERGASPGDLGIVRGMRASALVSLAVNANVKMKDTKKAIAYFERAYELRQDEFMRVLLACYRARDGRGEEARAILREISPSPANLYNVACTWALLGEKDLALDCLKRDLEENPMTPGAREKQKEWARQDPDLESVRDDARFRAIVGAPAGK
jgi:tetratricopeptide (TPR) repeat protein